MGSIWLPASWRWLTSWAPLWNRALVHPAENGEGAAASTWTRRGRPSPNTARLHPALPASFSRTLVLGALLWVLSGAPASWGAPPPFLGLLVLGLAGKGMGRAVLGQQGWGRRSF